MSRLGSYDVTPTERPNRLREIHLLALEIAIGEIGQGESGGLNNGGPAVWRYTRKPGSSGAWCAAFVSWCLEVAADRLGYVLPIRRSHGAQRLYGRIQAYGRAVDVPSPGDLLCWRRGSLRDWRGHIGIVERYENGRIQTVEGNRGPYPAVVSRFSYNLAVEEQGRLLGFARLW